MVDRCPAVCTHEDAATCEDVPALVAALRTVTAERDRLRAVADAAPGVLSLAWRGAASLADDDTTERMEDALRALGVDHG